MKHLDDKRTNGYCCCGLMHLRHAALVVTLLTLVDCVWDLTRWSRDQPLPAWIPSGACYYALSGIIRLFVSIVGIHGWLQPVARAWLVVTIFRGLEAAYYVAVGAVLLVSYVAYHAELWIVESTFGESVVPGIAVLLVLYALLPAWFATIAYRAFKWQKSEEKMLNDYIAVEVALRSAEESSGAEKN